MMYIFLLLITISSAFSLTDFNLSSVSVNCPASVTCSERTAKFKNLVGEYRSLVHLKDTLRVMASDGGYQTFFYELIEKDSKFILKIQFKLKPVIKEINIGFMDRNLDFDPSLLLNIREGDFFETQKLKESMDGLNQRLKDMGYPKNSHSFEVIESKNRVSINVVIKLGPPLIFREVITNSQSEYIQKFLKDKFRDSYNKAFDLNHFKLELDKAQKDLFSYGYYLIGLDFNPLINGSLVNLDIQVSNEQLFAFDFKNINKEYRDVLHDMIVDLFRKQKRPLTESSLRVAIRDHYQEKAFLNTKVKIEKTFFTNNFNEKVQLYRLFLSENEKTQISKVNFIGNAYFKKNKLLNMFKKDAFELASLGYYDREYFSYFQEYLKSQYISKGFVQVRISDPNLLLDADKKNVTVEYNIFEGVRAVVRRLDFDGLPTVLEEKINADIINTPGKYFNPIAMLDDIRKVATTLQENGYYYAEVTNGNDNDLVQYSKNGAEVYIRYKVETGPLVKLNRVLYLGNNKTKKRVIEKKIDLEKGDLLTPSRTREIEAAISATGLFNSVSVLPLRHNSKNAATDLVVKVVEREFGLVEVAPGYRTDLGVKLTATATYQNLGGYNRALTLKSTLNQRLSDRTLDPDRREDVKPLLEHNTSLTFSQGDVFDSLIDVSASMAYQTRRFYAFDANIYRASGTLSRDLTKKFSTSLRYQFEDIKQYNATEEFDNGSFVIGAITPSLTYDLRNNPVNPLKGAFFNLSTEFANPYFLSQKEPDLTINYYKLVSRNRFYIPFSNGTVAISFVGGVQENLAKEEKVIEGTQQTEGYIPNIKVFRLSGMDIVRGFNDEEINLLPDGRDISKVRIDQRAYMANFKLEPRYFINDSLMAGVFYDAGRVFVNDVNLHDLRDSVGVTFKIITPVGTLDFDYGIKLLRKKNADGSLESPGRFHVSIGFF